MNNYLLKSLIINFRRGDMSAFAIIYEQFKKLIFYYSKKSGDDDTVQELNIFLIELLYDIDIALFCENSKDGIQRYIAVSLKNEFLRICRQNSKTKNLYLKSFNQEFADSYSYNDLFIKEALSNLSAKQRLIIMYKYIYNYSDTEISAELNISRQAVNRLKNRALRELKTYYLEGC